ncbi:hypothetical protein [Streptomyces enissocaesilis]|uniref:Transposase n=1 Tax=Streptomyces enissocaesilis TaxID=332589 RepID=A0ABN3XQZ2_9ACTN
MRIRFQFARDHRDAYEVKRLCQILDVNRWSYCKRLAGAEAAWKVRLNAGAS